MRAFTARPTFSHPAPPPAPPRALRRAGLGLVEAMVALAITVALLTAVAAAFTASADAISENDQFFTASQGGRVALSQILTHVRRGTVKSTSTDIQLDLQTDKLTDVTYKYDAAAGQITMTKKFNIVPTTFVLARNVASCKFDLEWGQRYDGQPAITRVAVTMTVKVHNNSVLFSGTGASRSVMKF
ncbi:MAG TPA: hypothetical protein VER17_14305 [Tepidisphaeraceae bacterium]|nr:hypothetical protein [Tepidisphaeraceae bacterium]